MVSITVDASDVLAFTRRFANAQPIVERQFRTAMIRATAQVQHDAMALAPVDTGTLRRSLTTDVTPFVGRVGTNLPYAPVVEYGRREGAPMPPAGALLPWMRRHGISAEAEYAVRLRIARRGIRARPYLIPALERNREAIEREFALAMDAALRELAA